MNVLWICTDQQRFDTLGCYGNPFVHTPNLDGLAAQGMRFSQAYCQSPVCGPSRASFLTGRYPRTCGLRQNGQDIPGSEVLISKYFADKGYLCGLAGKLHLAAINQATGRSIEPRIDDGYHYFQWSHHPAEDNPDNNWPTNDYTRWLASQGIPFHTPSREDCPHVQVGMKEEYHQTTWCADRALEFMKAAKQYGKPWFFSMNLFDPHHAFDPPEEYINRYLDRLEEIPLPNYQEGELEGKPEFQAKDHGGAYDTPGNFAYDSMSERDHRMVRAAYWAMVDLIDAQVGRLLDYLDSSGQREDTLVIFTSDHGESLGDHGIYLKGPYFYEGSVHVPLILSRPGTIPEGTVCEDLVELTDLAPTLCAMAGDPPLPGMQGKSLAPVLAGGETAGPHRESVYCEYYNSNINHRDPLAFATMVFDCRYKLVKVHSREGNPPACQGELYDLREDPAERFNRYGDPACAEAQIHMLELLSDRMAQTCDPLPERKACW